ncbi:MAG TPA: VWA domain-containing protein, partial [Actinoplanes sp.]|nr:VWA domain-containing protein [Actinoplanes sp.]
DGRTGRAMCRTLKMPPAALAVLCAMLAVMPACTPAAPKPVALRVLATPELAGIEPILDELRAETGIRLIMDYRGGADATNALYPAGYQHDLAWLASERPYKLRLAASRYAGHWPLSTSIMMSPVVIGVRPTVATRLRADAGHHQLSWADMADGAAAGTVTFAMADPHRADSALAALVGVATAAAGTGRALGQDDVTCDRLRGFFSGQALTAPTSEKLLDGFVGRNDIDAVIADESMLLALNAGGRLREPLEIVYPTDGIVLSDFPLLLLAPGQRAAYDRVVAWLTRSSTQRKIMERTLRRPIVPNVVRDPRLPTVIGNSLHYPAQQSVIDTLLANYGRATPGRVVFLLDFSGSMRGKRMAALQSAFAGLAGEDSTSTGKFLRFHHDETFTLIKFGARTLSRRDFTIDDRQDVDAMLDFLRSGKHSNSTAIYSALDDGYRLSARLVRDEPRRPVSIVLMTDGENNAGMSFTSFRRRYRSLPAAVRAVPTNPVGFGDARQAELAQVARITGGRTIDATATSLREALKETRCG